MRTAKFHEALASAAENRGQQWKRVDAVDLSDVFWFTGGGSLNNGRGGVFIVDADDLTATWVCETEE